MGKYVVLGAIILLLEVSLPIIMLTSGENDINTSSSISSSTPQDQNTTTATATTSSQQLYLMQNKKLAIHNQNLNKLQKYLNEQQRKLINEHPGSLVAVARALKMAVVECQYQMRHEPWDCPVYGFSIRPMDIFGKLMLRSFKETSFIHSLLSSALAHSVARACTEQMIVTCQGRPQLTSRARYRENLAFGYRFAQSFMEATDELAATQDTIAAAFSAPTQSSSLSTADIANSIPSGRGPGSDAELAAAASAAAQLESSNNNAVIQPQSSYEQQQQQKLAREIRIRNLINAHNDKLGRELASMGMKKVCKCHGLSGACTMLTCWEELPPFREVASKLRDRFDQAIRVLPRANNPIGSSNIRQKSLTSSTVKKSNKKRSSAQAPVNRLSRSSSSSSLSPSTFKSNFYPSSPEAAQEEGSHKLPSVRSISRSSTNSTGPFGRSRGTKRHTDSDNCENCYRIPNAENADSLSPSKSSSQETTTGEGSSAFKAGEDNPAIAAQQYQHTFSSNSIAPATSKNTTLPKRRPVARSIGVSTATIMPTKYDLIYTDESPDFCIPNEIYNIKGTKGRICSESSNASNSCKRLCCGRGYKREVREEKYKCECQFKFCCKLECNTCTRLKVVHKCL